MLPQQNSTLDFMFSIFVFDFETTHRLGCSELDAWFMHGLCELKIEETSRES